MYYVHLKGLREEVYHPELQGQDLLFASIEELRSIQLLQTFDP